MPSTRDLDDEFDVTFRVESHVGSVWVVTGEVFAKPTGKPIGVEVEGEGRTLSAAEERAWAKVRQMDRKAWRAR